MSESSSPSTSRSPAASDQASTPAGRTTPGSELLGQAVGVDDAARRRAPRGAPPRAPRWRRAAGRRRRARRRGGPRCAGRPPSPWILPGTPPRGGWRTGAARSGGGRQETPAGGRVAAAEAGQPGVGPLLRGAVVVGAREVEVADRLGGGDRLGDVRVVEPALGVDGAAPGAGQAVGLQLEGLGAVGPRDAEQAQLGLEVVPVLVGEDVGDAEVARGPAPNRPAPPAGRSACPRRAVRRRPRPRRSCRRWGSRRRLRRRPRRRTRSARGPRAGPSGRRRGAPAARSPRTCASRTCSTLRRTSVRNASISLGCVRPRDRTAGLVRRARGTAALSRPRASSMRARSRSRRCSALARVSLASWSRSSLPQPEVPAAPTARTSAARRAGARRTSAAMTARGPRTPRLAARQRRERGQPEAPDRLLAQQELLDLAGDGHRELVDDEHVARDLEVREPARAELAHRVGVERLRPGAQPDPRAELLAVALVGHADRPGRPRCRGARRGTPRPRAGRRSRRRG